MSTASPPDRADTPDGLRSLARFQGYGYDKGRPVLVQALWFAVQNLLFSQWWLPSAFRPRLLRLFGARIGEQVFIRHRVRVLWPWKLTVGDHCWIGEDAWLLDLEPITLDHDVCVSQGVLLCAGSHDRRSPTFEYDNGPVTIDAGVWLGARATVLRGVRVGAGSVVAAGSTVTRDVPAHSLVATSGEVRSQR